MRPVGADVSFDMRAPPACQSTAPGSLRRIGTSARRGRSPVRARNSLQELGGQNEVDCIGDNCSGLRDPGRSLCGRQTRRSGGGRGRRSGCRDCRGWSRRNGRGRRNRRARRLVPSVGAVGRVPAADRRRRAAAGKLYLLSKFRSTPITSILCSTIRGLLSTGTPAALCASSHRDLQHWLSRPDLVRAFLFAPSGTRGGGESWLAKGYGGSNAQRA